MAEEKEKLTEYIALFIIAISTADSRAEMYADLPPETIFAKTDDEALAAAWRIREVLNLLEEQKKSAGFKKFVVLTSVRNQENKRKIYMCGPGYFG